MGRKEHYGSIVIEEKGLSAGEGFLLVVFGVSVMGVAVAVAVAVIQLSAALSTALVAIGLGLGGSLLARGVAEVIVARGRARAMVIEAQGNARAALERERRRALRSGAAHVLPRGRRNGGELRPYHIVGEPEGGEEW